MAGNSQNVSLWNFDVAFRHIVSCGQYGRVWKIVGSSQGVGVVVLFFLINSDVPPESKDPVADQSSIPPCHVRACELPHFVLYSTRMHRSPFMQ